MTNDTSYRLGRFEIVEKENGEIHWTVKKIFTKKPYLSQQILQKALLNSLKKAL